LIDKEKKKEGKRKVVFFFFFGGGGIFKHDTKGSELKPKLNRLQ